MADLKNMQRVEVEYPQLTSEQETIECLLNVISSCTKIITSITSGKGINPVYKVREMTICNFAIIELVASREWMRNKQNSNE